MSNNDDFDFNRDSLFDDDFDDNSSGDDFGNDDFDFGDDNDDFNLDDDDFGNDLDSALGGDDDDFGGGDDDDFGTTESGASGGGTSRGFIIAAVVMGFLFLAGFGLIVFILMRGNPEERAFLATSAAIETLNAENMTLIASSATAAIENATATQGAVETATAAYTPPTETPTPTLTPTEDATATAVEATNQAIAAQQTADAQVFADATNTEIAFQLTLNPVTATPEGGIVAATEDPSLSGTEDPAIGGSEEAPQGNTPVPLPAVQQTATELARLFAATPTQSSGGELATDVVGTQDVVIGGGTPTGSSTSGSGTGNNGQLPDTGLFDDVFQGNPSVIFLAAFGLLGVIVFSRSVRKRKHDD